MIAPKRFHSGLVLGLGALVLPGIAHAGQANGRAEIAVLRTLSFIKIDDLEFGNLIAGPTAGTITVSPFGARSTTGAVTVAGGLFQQAQFGGRGAPNQNLAISMTTNTVTLTRAGGTQTMVADNFVIGSTPVQPLSTSVRRFVIGSPTGVFQFGVGARLNVGPNQTPGVYSGTFRITLIYQ